MKNIKMNPSLDVESLLSQAFDVCTENINQLKNECGDFPEITYFLNEILSYYKPEHLLKKYPKIIVYGTDFPMEIVYSLTKEPPFWVIGGNRIFTAVSDEYVPRDTDPVSRAVLGQLLTMEHMKDEALIIVPCSSDAQRKTAYFLQRQGWKTVTIWIPAVKDAQAHKGFLSELEHAIGTICNHLGKRYSQSLLTQTTRYINEIRASIHDFLDAANTDESQISGMLRMAIIDSLFMTEDLECWHKNLKSLTEKIQRQKQVLENEKPKILLIGSPVYFPNFKIPMLLSEAGVEICGSIDSRTGQYENAFSGNSQKGLAELASYYFEHDSSSAFVNNDRLVAAIRHYVEETKPDGIIWHVLKGQIEYDFELNRNEVYFEEKKLPVIRLETDYQFQDIEQLRIRVEAFSELLRQKKTEVRRIEV